MTGQPLTRLSSVCVLLAALVSCGGDGSPASLSSAVESSPVHSSAAATTTSVPPDTSAPTTSTTAATTTNSTSPGRAEYGFDPPCSEWTNPQAAFRFANEQQLDTFGPLAATPALEITLPQARSSAEMPWLSPTAKATRIPGGLLIALNAPDSDYFSGSMLAAVDADGVRRWVRCYGDSIVGVFTAPASSNPARALVSFSTAPSATQTLSDWRLVSLADGSFAGSVGDLMSQDHLDATSPVDIFPLAVASNRVVLGPPSGATIDLGRDRLWIVHVDTWAVDEIVLPKESEGQMLIGQRFEIAGNGDLVLLSSSDTYASVASSAYHDGSWTSEPAVLRQTNGVRPDFANTATDGPAPLVGVDALGNVVWSGDVASYPAEGFRVASSGSVTVVLGCFGNDVTTACENISLGGVDTSTGEVLWRLPGRRLVPVVSDGYAIISGPVATTPDGSVGHGSWVMIDTATGQDVGAGQAWANPDTFLYECCADSANIWVQHHGGVVVATNRQFITVWYPNGTLVSTSQVTIP